MAFDVRSRLIAPALIAPLGNTDKVDVSGIVHRLLFFDDYILQSVRLREFPGLVDAMGYPAVMELLSARVLKVHCDATTVGQTGQLEILDARRKKGLLPLGSFSFSAVRIADRNQYIHSCLKEIEPRFSLAPKELMKLKRAIVTALVDIPSDVGNDTVLQLQQDLHGNSPLLGPLIAQSVQRLHNVQIEPKNLTVRTHAIEETDFAVETNLEEMGFDELQRHNVVESALLAFSGLNQRIEEMKTYNALSGCIDAECVFFKERLGFLLQGMRPAAAEEQFQRVLDLCGIPSFCGGEANLDASKLLDIKSSKEFAEFRVWLRTLDANTSDKEIEDRVSSYKARIANIIRSPVGKTVRFVTVTGVGLVPGYGTAAGVALGIIDTFLLDKILPTSGIWTFVNKQYPSIFEKRQEG